MGDPERLSQTSFPASPSTSPGISESEQLDPGEISQLRDDLKNCFERKEVVGGYLIIRKGRGVELQARINGISFPGGSSSNSRSEEIFSFGLEESSLNGTIVGKMKDKEIGCFVNDGIFHGLPFSVVRINFVLCLPSAPSRKYFWNAHLQGCGPAPLVLEGMDVIIGSPVTLEREGTVVLKDGKFNPTLLVPEAR